MKPHRNINPREPGCPGHLACLALWILTAPWLPASGPGTIASPAPAAHWRVEYEYAGSKPAGGGALNRVRIAEYEVYRDTAKITKSFEDGSQHVEYLVDGYLYRQDRQTRQPVIVAVSGDDSDYQCRRRFPDFPASPEKYYAGEAEAFGEKCFVFRMEPRISGQSLDGMGQKPWEGWVSMATGRPRAFRMGDVSAKFLFLDPPTGPISLPQNYADLAQTVFRTPLPPGSLAGKKR